MLDTSLHPALGAIAERCDIVPVTKASDAAAWHRLRRGGIGSSDAGAILGLSPYAGPIDVWGAKTGWIPPKDLSGNDAVWFGTNMEPVIAKWYAERTGDIVIAPDCTFVLKSDPILRTNPDLLVLRQDGSLGIVEVKTADAHLSSDWVEGEASPPWYQAQVGQQRAVLGPSIDWQEIVCLVGGNKPVRVPIDLEQDFLDELAAHLIDWWHTYVVTNTRPPVDGAKHTTEALGRLYKDEGSTIFGNLELLDLTVAYELAHEAVKAAEAEKNLIGNQIRAALGHASKAMFGGIKIASWAEHDVDRFDQKEHEYQQPGCHKTYRDKTTERSMLIARTKDAIAMRARRAEQLRQERAA